MHGGIILTMLTVTAGTRGDNCNDQREGRDKSNSIVYTRWGRDDCPTNTQTVYTGIAGGSSYFHTGAAADPLCLPSDPEWGLYTDTEDSIRAYVYGAEYQFHTLTDSRKKVHDYDVPCAVCRVMGRSTVITIPERNSSTSIVYTRWGRDDCPTHSLTEYSGFSGGSYFTNKGAAAEPLCLPPDPEWGLHTESADNSRGYVYGAEYEFGTLTDSRKNLHEHDVPCAVCRVKQRSVVITIPARKSCYPGWYQEYTGYLVAGYHGHEAATQYTCIDVNPIGTPNSQGNQNGKLFYPVESRCGSLPCPPYVNGRELTCVVCSI